MTRSKERKPMTVIGITGGIGSGKSAVGKMLTEMGCEVIDSDSYTRSVLKRGQPAYADIVAYFGNGILGGDGEIDRGKLAAVVFADKDKLERLNSFTHDRILRMIAADVEKIRREGTCDIVALEVPIPVEKGFCDSVDVILTIQSDRSDRIDRLRKRGGFDERKIERVLGSQMKDEDYAKIADVVIRNDGNMEDLRSKVAAELEKIRK